MTNEAIREYSLAKAGVTEGLPFGDTVLVFKVMGKMFLLMSLESSLSINVKCEPELAIQLREKYPDVLPGYHMNKVHWNTININGSIAENLIKDWIDLSYRLIADSLPKKDKIALGA